MSRPLAALAVGLHIAACGPPTMWHGTSPDHRRAFAVAERGEQTCMTLDGGSAQCFDGMALSRIVFSPDSRSMAYPVQVGDDWFVVRDGQPGPASDGIGEMTFSPDGSRLAYTAVRNDAWHVVVDDEFGEPYDSLLAGTLVFDPTGRRHAFVAVRQGRTVAVVDGEEGAPRDGIAQLRFSPEGNRIAYVARSGTRVALSIDGSLGGEHDAITEYEFALAGPRAAYVAMDGGAAWVFTGAERLGPYLEARDVRYRPFDGELYFVARDAEGVHVVAAGEPGPAHEAVDPPVFSATGPAWGYIARDSVASSVMLDGRVVDSQAWAGDLVFSADGSRYAYLVRRADADVVISDRGIEALDMAVDGTLQFTNRAEWAVLAGSLPDRRLYAKVEGHAEVRRFEWSDLAGVAGTRATGEVGPEAGLAALRAWVAAEAEVILEGSTPGT